MHCGIIGKESIPYPVMEAQCEECGQHIDADQATCQLEAETSQIGWVLAGSKVRELKEWKEIWEKYNHLKSAKSS